MQFKYFDRPDLFTGFLDDPAECDICGIETECFDAESFLGEEDLEAVCPACISNGKLKSKKVFTNQGDAAELKRQLKELNPGMSATDITKLAKQKTTELEKATPHLTTWQDWDWPSADGDYCKFIAYGSRALYEKIANGQPPKSFFEDSIYHTLKEITDAGEMWDEVMPEKEIKNYEDSSQYGTLFYVFKSLHSDKVVTIWDCD